MQMLKPVIYGAGRILKATLLFRWEPIPVAGAGLLSVWALWAAIALTL
jgi:hypothetical protein